MHARPKEIETLPAPARFDGATRIERLALEVTGAVGAASLGELVRLSIGNGKKISCEAVGFRDGRPRVTPIGPLDGIVLDGRAKARCPKGPRLTRSTRRRPSPRQRMGIFAG